MSLLVVTGGARSGKSGVGARLALARGGRVVAAVAGAAIDDEMRRRIEHHRRDRRVDWETLELGADPVAQLREVPDDVCLLLDCLGSVVGRVVADISVGDVPIVSTRAEQTVAEQVAGVTTVLTTRRGDSVVVTNEVGDGVVPAYADGRLFRDVLGRANRQLVDVADGAWLVVAGRCIDIARAPIEPEWPTW